MNFHKISFFFNKKKNFIVKFKEKSFFLKNYKKSELIKKKSIFKRNGFKQQFREIHEITQ